MRRQSNMLFANVFMAYLAQMLYTKLRIYTIPHVYQLVLIFMH